MDFEQAKEMLLRAEADCRPMGPISELIPGGLTLEDAHAICEGNIERRLRAGEKLAGYKVGFTNIPLREKMGLPDSTYGYVTDRMVLQSGAKLEMGKMIAAKIECEICFLLGKDLEGSRLTVEDVLSATEGVSASFEICDSRIKDWKCPYPDFFADNGFSCGVVLPGHWHPVKGLDLLSETVVLSKEGQRIAEGRGETALGNPARAVSWLAGKLAGRGRKLRAGQFVMTGTLTPILPVEKGSTYVADFSTLGRVSVTFS
jgi:2-keto-4-pentenoate hydratase